MFNSFLNSTSRGSLLEQDSSLQPSSTLVQRNLKKSELRNHHNGSYGRAGNKKDISFSNNGHAKTNFCVRKADNTVELKAARLCDCFLVLHLIYLQEVY